MFPHGLKIFLFYLFINFISFIIHYSIIRLSKNIAQLSVSTVEDDVFIEIWGTTSETRSIALMHGSAPIHIYKVETTIKYPKNKRN